MRAPQCAFTLLSLSLPDRTSAWAERVFETSGDSLKANDRNALEPFVDSWLAFAIDHSLKNGHHFVVIVGDMNGISR